MRHHVTAEHLTSGITVHGMRPLPVTMLATIPHGPDTVELVFRDAVTQYVRVEMNRGVAGQSARTRRRRGGVPTVDAHSWDRRPRPVQGARVPAVQARRRPQADQVALDFNALGTAWNDITAGVGPSAEQATFDYTED